MLRRFSIGTRIVAIRQGVWADANLCGIGLDKMLNSSFDGLKQLVDKGQ